MRKKIIMSQQTRFIRLIVISLFLSMSHAYHHHHHHHHRHHPQIRSTTLNVLNKQSMTVPSSSSLYSVVSPDQSNKQLVEVKVQSRMYKNSWLLARNHQKPADDEFKKRSRAMKFWQSIMRRRRRLLVPILIVTSLLLFYHPGVALASSEAVMTTATTAATGAATTMSQAAGVGGAAAVPATTTTTAAPIIPILSCPVSAATEIRLMIRLVYAALLGSALGMERSFAKHSAGVRTMSLVSMGACCFTICSCYGFSNFARVDVSRMASNVASGVGFVGAGVITTSVHNQDGSNRSNPQNNIVHGLTTAATIWLSAAVGVSCGVGLLRIATTAAFATIFILRMGRKNPNTVDHQKQRSILRSEYNEDDDDDDKDINAEIHMTGVCDEHPHHHESKKYDKKTYLQQLEEPNQKESKRNNRVTTSAETTNQLDPSTQNNRLFGTSSVSNRNSSQSSSGDEIVPQSIDTLKDPSELMEEVVRSAWQNDNKTKSHLADLEPVEQQRERRVSKRRSSSSSSNGDDSVSSNPEYLP